MTLYVVMLCPSYQYAVFIYIPGVFATLGLTALHVGQFNMETLQNELTRYDYTLIPFAFVIAYFLQRRELKRFFEQQKAKKQEQKAIKKEEQVTTVLNA